VNPIFRRLPDKISADVIRPNPGVHLDLHRTSSEIIIHGRQANDGFVKVVLVESPCFQMGREDRFDLERGVFVMLFEDLESEETINIRGWGIRSTKIDLERGGVVQLHKS
jgi:hypothetical protein